MAALLLLAMDVSARACGMALGPTDAKPQVAVKAFRQKGESIDVSIDAMAVFMRDLFERSPPDLVAVERYIAKVFRKEPGWIRDEQLLMFSAIRTVTVCYGASFVCEQASTIRKHFCGRAWSDNVNVDTKGMVLTRARQLGYDVGNDTDKADACATWDWAASTHARRAPAFTLV